MSKKEKINYVCSECGESTIKWSGQCPSCKAWNTLKEFVVTDKSNANTKRNEWVESKHKEFIKGRDVKSNFNISRLKTGIEELDNVMGDGIAIGSVNLISGDPGIGKSTLLIQAICGVLLKTDFECGYISGEESIEQIRNRAERIGVDDRSVNYLSETNVETIIEKIEKNNIKFVIIDSIQTIFTETSKSAAGSSTQLRESAAMLNAYAKNKGITMMIVGHVTKDGSVAGPKILEHIVDAVYQIEGDSNSRFRIMRSFKNRYGETSEIGIFAMTEKGMMSVKNPSAMFISSNKDGSVGSSIVITKEGKRSIMYELQSLVTSTDLEIPQRLSIGLNAQRVKMILAIMQKHLRLSTYKKDVYITVLGGVQIPMEDTSSDLSLVFSIFSASEDFIVPKGLCSFGEVSLTGEIRPVPYGEDRIREAAKHGFKYIILPFDNFSKSIGNKKYNIEIIPVRNIGEAINQLKNIAKDSN